MDKSSSLSLGCYALNEEELLEHFFRKSIADLKKVTDDYEIIFIDDGSTDRSWEIAHKLSQEFPQIKIYQNDRNRGVGYSALKAYKLAQKEIVFCNTIDMFFDTADLPRYLEYFKPIYDYNLVIGVRLKRRGCYSLYRQFISWTNYYLVKWLFRVPFRDVQNVFFLPRGFLKEVEIISRSSLISPELLIKARQMGLKVKEVPMVFHQRETGKARGAKLKYLYQSIRDLIKLFIYWYFKGVKKKYTAKSNLTTHQ